MELKEKENTEDENLWAVDTVCCQALFFFKAAEWVFKNLKINELRVLFAKLGKEQPNKPKESKRR